LYLYDYWNGTKIASSASASNNDDVIKFLINKNKYPYERSTYGIHVKSYSGGSPIYFNLTVSSTVNTYANCLVAFNDFYDTNDSFDNAFDLGYVSKNTNQNFQGLLGGSKQNDFFKFKNYGTGTTGITSSTTAILELTNIPKHTDYDLFFYDQNKNLIGSSTKLTNADEKIVVDISNKIYLDDFYINVHSYSGYDLSSYYNLNFKLDYYYHAERFIKENSEKLDPYINKTNGLLSYSIPTSIIPSAPVHLQDSVREYILNNLKSYEFYS